MSSKRGMIQVELDGLTWLFEAKTVVYMQAPAVFPVCAHCGSKITTLLREDTQHGWYDDKHRLIVYCEECTKVTLAEYRLPNEIPF